MSWSDSGWWGGRAWPDWSGPAAGGDWAQGRESAAEGAEAEQPAPLAVDAEEPVPPLGGRWADEPSPAPWSRDVQGSAGTLPEAFDPWAEEEPSRSPASGSVGPSPGGGRFRTCFRCRRERTLVPSGQCTLCARLETLFYRSLSLRADSAQYLFLCRLLDGLDFLHASSFEYEQTGARGFDRDFVFPPGRD